MWDKAKKSFEKNENILIAFPLFAETIPSDLIEFLKGVLYQPTTKKKKISFILQSASLEACQRKCCEVFLERIVNNSGYCFGGVLSIGDMFGLWLNDERPKQKLKTVEKAAVYFSKNGNFGDFERSELKGPDSVGMDEARLLNRFHKFVINEYAEILGCTEDLRKRPLENVSQIDNVQEV